MCFGLGVDVGFKVGFDCDVGDAVCLGFEFDVGMFFLVLRLALVFNINSVLNLMLLRII